MIRAIFHGLFYDPLYNGIIGLVHVFPWLDAGMIVLLFTIIVRLALFPLSKKSVRTQALMRGAQADLDEIKKKYTNREEQSRKVMEYYKEKNINPFASMLFLFIQIPILLALYRIFYYHGLSVIRFDMLYSFIHAPGPIAQTFLGLFDINSKNYILAALAGIAQYFQAHIMAPQSKKLDPNKKKNFSDDLANSMNTQMKYVLPFVIAIGAYHGGAAIGIYWVTSTVFTIVQEIVVRKQLKKQGVM